MVQRSRSAGDRPLRSREPEGKARLRLLLAPGPTGILDLSGHDFPWATYRKGFRLPSPILAASARLALPGLISKAAEVPGWVKKGPRLTPYKSERKRLKRRKFPIFKRIRRRFLFTPSLKTKLVVAGVSQKEIGGVRRSPASWRSRASPRTHRVFARSDLSTGAEMAARISCANWAV